MTQPARGETIFALSSGRPPAAIAVVRISGPDAGTALVTLAGTLPRPRQASLRALRDTDGALLDQALVLWLPGPASATGEDLAELHLHGGRAVVAAVEHALATIPGLTPAEPGGFTRRAFANGRIDLLQTEGLADLLEAETEGQRRHALALAEGGLTRDLDALRLALLDVSARVELVLDHAEDDDAADLDADFLCDLATLRARIADRLNWPGADRLRHGVRVVVAGPPNAGKSSLVNALARRETALVSANPGTTRDLIEVPLQIGGLPMVLVDSAGLRADAPDEVERLGIDRARQAIEGADILLWLGLPQNAPDHACTLRIRARADVDGGTPNDTEHDLAVSSKTGQGLEILADMIAERGYALLPNETRLGLGNEQRQDLQEVQLALAAAEQEQDVILVAEQLRWARDLFDRLTGRAGTEEMLDRLFSRFCVGK